jgi:hypothetical protein
MRRKLFTLAAASSAVLCAAVCVLWVRSYWVSDSWERDVPGTRVGVGSYSGHVWWARKQYKGTIMFNRTPGYHAIPTEAFATNTLPPTWEFAGFRWTHFRLTGGLVLPFVSQEFRVPDWAVVLATGALPSVWLARRIRRQRRAAGLCPACGYDLRATPDRCPECGTIPSQ